MSVASATCAEDLLLSVSLDAGWEMSSAASPLTPGKSPLAPDTLSRAAFIPAQVPGTVASALRERGLWRVGAGASFDASEHWFRCRFEAWPAETGEEIVLRFGGIATLSEVWLNGAPILTSDSMFAAHDVDVTPLVRDHNELVIVCRPLTEALRGKRRSQPVARWRTKVVAEQQLRWFRTTLLGRAPGFAREPEPVGPWRPITLLRRRRMVIEQGAREVSIDGSFGVIRARFRLRALDREAQPVWGRLVAGDTAAALTIEESPGAGRSALEYEAHATLRIHHPHPWMPHTHGEPTLYPLRVEVRMNDGSIASFDCAPVGFRALDAGVEVAGDDGLALRINGTPVFCRGVVWTPPDLAALAAPAAVIRERLELLRDAGVNLIRLAGTTIYEDETFHRLCDELGLLVWQDMMFANMDYPYADPGFRDAIRTEAESELLRLARHPSLAVICGNSEIEQQAGMLGLSSEIGRGEWFGRDLPRIASRCCPGVPYVPSAPCGGDAPFGTREGIANYFGVGAYLRPLEDARRAEVRFASECLAFSHVPEPEAVDKMAFAIPGGISPVHPAWKRGVPRDSGASWDFEDVRDHYLKLLYGVDAAALRATDVARYWELSRMVPGEVMAEVFGEWRRPASPCAGGIVLWAADLEPGAGWGILDHQGFPKSSYWFLRRALAPRAVWTTDEGLNGIDVHVANDAPERLEARLRVALYRSGEQCVGQAERTVSIAAGSAVTLGVEKILGRFADAAYAYRFGPPGHDVVVCSLHQGAEDFPFAQCFRMPAGRPAARVAMGDLNLCGHARMLPGGAIEVLLSSRRFAWGVRAALPGYLAEDAYFGLEPGVERRIVLTRLGANREQPGTLKSSTVTVTAVNAEGRLAIPVEQSA